MPLSPMMQHYIQTKEKYKDAILFYRLGDFYEMFFEDAKIVSKVLDLTLTGKDCGLEERAPMCGIPYHAVDSYIAKLVKNGYKVAICEQIGEIVKNKAVSRDVVKVVTAGTIPSEIIQDETSNNFILSICEQKNRIGIAYADITTGEFFTTEYNKDIYSNLNDLIMRIKPAEIICNYYAKSNIETLQAWKILNLPSAQNYYETSFIDENSLNSLKKQFGETVVSVFELGELPNAICASGALIDYLNETQKVALKQIIKIKKLDEDLFLHLDLIARRNLEISETMRDRRRKGSLISILDNTKTAMGARLFRNWLDEPLKQSNLINERLDSVEELYTKLMLRDNITEELKKLCDIERLTSKIGMASIMPKDCIKLKQSLAIVPKLKEQLINTKSAKLVNIYNSIISFSPLQNFLEQAIKEEPSVHLKDGDFIKQGFNVEVDSFRKMEHNGGVLMQELAENERLKTGITNLKIKFNNVYNYYIEIPKDLSNLVPINYHRKQTVGNFDRYFTEDLKNLEEQILTAEDKRIKLEQQIFALIREKLQEYIEPLQNVSKAISELDCLVSLASVAVKNNYVKPIINNKIKQIKIVEGRHPVVENYLKSTQFIANDTFLNNNSDRIMILTGPNMAGKSTYMRQVAIITLMAHIGSFVPAKYAEIAITDRIFTRVGASDDLAFGQSTFMVEMTEMANIIHNATDNSLIVLDEIGRGTSTFDGLSIAWAVVEYLAHKTKAKVLFATHYHELTELEGVLEGVKNYKINVKEINNSIVFLRKIVRGGANRSFGIEVASLAGIPKDIIERAKEISHNIAEQDFNIKLANETFASSAEFKEKQAQSNQIVGILQDLNINKITPLDAFEILGDLIQKSK